MDHLKNHVEALMEWNMLCEDDKDASVESVCNEATSTVTRPGAPLANASIDRRCLQQYTSTIIDEDANALTCLSSARKYPPISKQL